MNQMNEISITDRVRSFAAAGGLVRKKQVAESLGITIDQTVAAFGTLLQQGFLKRVGHGTYEYVDRPMAGAPSPINDRAWRAMRIHPRFSCSELARVSGTTTNYIYKLVRKYRAEGLIEPDGRQMALSGAEEKMWRLTAKGKQHRERPLLKTFEPDPLVVKVVTLNRLVCSGVARHFPEDRAKAVALCADIADALTENPAPGSDPPEKSADMG